MTLPKFQQWQYQFAAQIRDPQKGSMSINANEMQRLKIYQELFFNNISEFLSSVFPVLHDILGQEVWLALIREYLKKHQAQTPLFYELGQEFLNFLEHEHQALPNEPLYVMQLAHYEWVELALSVLEGDVQELKETTPVSLRQSYGLAPLTWVLSYDWPVHRISKSMQPQQPEATYLLVRRTSDDEIEFVELMPLLFSLLKSFENAAKITRPGTSLRGITAQKAFEDLAHKFEKPTEELMAYAESTLASMVKQGWIVAL